MDALGVESLRRGGSLHGRCRGAGVGGRASPAGHPCRRGLDDGRPRGAAVRRARRASGPPPPARSGRETCSSRLVFDQALVTESAVAARAAAMRAGAAAFASLFPPPRARWADDLTLSAQTLAGVRAPVLLVHGAEDRVTPLEDGSPAPARTPGRCPSARARAMRARAGGRAPARLQATPVVLPPPGVRSRMPTRSVQRVQTAPVQGATATRSEPSAPATSTTMPMRCGVSRKATSISSVSSCVQAAEAATGTGKPCRSDGSDTDHRPDPAPKLRELPGLLDVDLEAMAGCREGHGGHTRLHARIRAGRHRGRQLRALQDPDVQAALKACGIDLPVPPSGQ